MARPCRYTVPGQPHHVIQRGVNRSTIFVRQADQAYFRACLAIALERYHCRLHAYVLMTNHVHLLVTPPEPTSIARLVQWVSRFYVPWFNQANRRTGTLWEGRYRATVIDSDRYLLASYRYVEMNPVRAGVVADPADYPWSSFRSNALGALDPLVTPHPLYEGLDVDTTARRSAYRALFNVAVDDETLRDLRAATRTGRQLSVERQRQHLMALSVGRVQRIPRSPQPGE